MKSHEAFRSLIKKHGAKQLAAELGVSPSTLYKWSEPGECHRKNPCERLALLRRATGDNTMLQLLCAEADGFFVANPPVAAPRATKAKMETLDLTLAEAVVLRDEAELLSSLAELLAEKNLSRAEVSRLRARWERCKTDMERLVRALEGGEFRKQLMAWLLKFYPVCDALTPGGLI